jgi:hypothetical protein
MISYKKRGGIHFLTIGSFRIQWSKDKRKPITEYELQARTSWKADLLYWIDTGEFLGNAPLHVVSRYFAIARRRLLKDHRIVEDTLSRQWLKSKGVA